MKIKNLFSLLFVCAVGFAAVSCSDDDDPKWNDDGSKVVLPEHRMFILNEGSFNLNNACIEFYAPKKDADIIDDIFYKQNGVRLGDTAQDMIGYKGNIYVAVYRSNYLAKLNAACVEETRVSFIGDPDLQAGIRYMAAEDGYIYASFHGGVVAKINAKTLQVEAKLHVGSNLEGVAIEDDNLYVANSYSQGESGYVYFTDVFVIDLRTFTKKETLTVVKNPNDVIEEDDKVFVISHDYGRESYVLQMIDPAANNSVKELCYATQMAGGNDMLYIVDSRTDYSSKPWTAHNTFSTYNIKTGKLNQTSFLKNAPVELGTASIYMMVVDDETGDIYLGVTHYADSNGEMYRFKKDGTFVEKFDCGGQNPRRAVFFD